MKNRKNFKIRRIIAAALMITALVAVIVSVSLPVFAEETVENVTTIGAENDVSEKSGVSAKAIGACLAVGVAAAAGAVGMAVAIAKSAESMARQPEAAGKINSAMMLGLVFIETTILYAFIVAILIIFVL